MPRRPSFRDANPGFAFTEAVTEQLKPAPLNRLVDGIDRAEALDVMLDGQFAGSRRGLDLVGDPTGTVKASVSDDEANDKIKLSYAVDIIQLGNRLVDLGFATGVTSALGAFHGYLSGAQAAIAQNAWVKIPFDTEEFDVSGWFDSTTANKGRYTPAAGFYRLSANASFTTLTAGAYTVLSIWKNGGEFVRGTFGENQGAVVTGLVKANGTDYFEIYVYNTDAAGRILFVPLLAFTGFYGEQVAPLVPFFGGASTNGGGAVGATGSTGGGGAGGGGSGGGGGGMGGF